METKYKLYIRIYTYTQILKYTYLYFASSCRFMSRNIYKRNFLSNYHRNKTRCANGHSRPDSSTLSDIHFARTFVHRAINSTNAKYGKLMSAASTWTRELRLACVIPLNYSRNPVSSSSPIQTRLGPGHAFGY